MLAPRFTIRTLLAVLTGGAILFLVVGMAIRGEVWAWGVTIGVFSLGVTALAHAAWFGLAWLFAQLPSSRRVARGEIRLSVPSTSVTESARMPSAAGDRSDREPATSPSAS